MAENDERQVDGSDATLTDNLARQQAREAREDVDQLRMIMQRPRGRAFLYRLIARGAPLENPVAMLEGRPTDTHMTYYRIGRQDMGRELHALAQRASPELYLIMMNEAREARETQEVNVMERNRAAGAAERLEPNDQFPHLTDPNAQTVRAAPKKK